MSQIDRRPVVVVLVRPTSRPERPKTTKPRATPGNALGVPGSAVSFRDPTRRPERAHTAPIYMIYKIPDQFAP